MSGPIGITRRLGELLLGTEPRLRGRLTMCLLANSLYLGWLLFIALFIVPRGLVSPGVGQFLMAHQLIALITFYPLVRSGLTHHWSDPGLVLPQIAWACLALVVGYAVSPIGRAVSLQTMSLIVVFGFLSLRPRAAVWTGIGMICMLLGMLVWCILSRQENFEPRLQTLIIVTTCFILALLTWQSHGFAMRRKRMSADRKALAAALQEVEVLMQHDTLTGLYNRQHLQTRLEAERERARAGGHRFCVALIDLDHFKLINDRHGHAMGDHVLVAFARQAQAVLRETDTIARWGGEEFLILLPDTEPVDKAGIALRRLQASLRGAPISDAEPNMRVTFSAGVAEWAKGESIEQLLDRADAALYDAKRQGRDRAVQAPLPLPAHPAPP
ncbi:GGDEF domain-containing protein [Aquabacterium soli]|uniref:diguanylate cyclase n=1 Tax=Aquabacterium soli TaxID=2493092 RepID=A0A426VCK8_9BURK|nr:GGDEF domain-containing protein [Aquabacterium soli]RRS04623.1 GGDEF domain-containing protein [Aquabacterium soli]